MIDYPEYTITVPQKAMDMAIAGNSGAYIMFIAEVNWPELRLTEEQMIANAIAYAWNQPIPYPNRQLIPVRVPVQPRTEPTHASDLSD